MQQRVDLFALGGFAALSALFFWQLWALNLADRMTIGAPDGDFLRQFYPYRVFVARAWASLQPPLWNPHQYAGTPAWADPQLAVVYPWRWLQVPLALGGRTLPLWSVHLEVVAHVALAGWFTYLLLRRLGAGLAGAALAGIAFAFGGYLTGYPVAQLAVLDSAVWIPASLWTLTASCAAAVLGDRGAAVRWMLVAGGMTALALLAGHPQTALYCLYAGAAWLLWRGLRVGLGLRRTALVGAGWLGFALGLSAVQWLPATDFLTRSARAFDYAALSAGFPLRDVVQVLAPIAQVVAGQAAAAWQWSPLYVGAAVLALGLWAAWRVADARFWLGLAGVAWLVSLGGAGPLYPLLYRVAPGFALFRQQERIAVLVSLGLAVAAGLALSALAEGLPRSWRELGRWLALLAAGFGLLAAVGVAGPESGPVAPFASSLAFSALMLALAAGLAGLAAAERLPGRRAALALVVLTVFELFSVNRGRALSPGGNPYQADELTQALLPHAADGRVSSEGRLPGGPNAATVFGLFDTTGDSPLQLAATARLVGEVPEMVWWRLLGVRYLVTERDAAAEAPARELARQEARGLYEVELPVPPAWVPEQVASPPGAWTPPADFDPLALAVLPPAAGVPALKTGVGGTARVVGQSTDRLTVEAELPGSGLVVAATPFDPGWRLRATAEDGHVLTPPTVNAYGALLSAVLPAGRWRLEWTYRPASVLFGLAVTGVTLLLGALLWRWPWARKSAPTP
jgi:hypothetical protein